MPQLFTTDLGGSGRPFVLVHGYTGSSDDFVHVAPRFTDQRHVVLVDQLGHGRSPRAETYDHETLTAALIEHLEGFGEPVDLLGHSLGGRTILPIAIHRPDVVHSLILMDTWADDADRSDEADFLAEAFTRPQPQALAALDAFWSAPGPEQQLIAAHYGAQWLADHDAWNAGQVDPKAKYQLGQTMFVMKSDVLPACASIAAPTTVICGEHDLPFLGPSARLADTIPGARLVTIAGAYHSPQLTHPDEWTAAVDGHLAWVA